MYVLWTGYQLESNGELQACPRWQISSNYNNFLIWHPFNNLMKIQSPVSLSPWWSFLSSDPSDLIISTPCCLTLKLHLALSCDLHFKIMLSLGFSTEGKSLSCAWCTASIKQFLWMADIIWEIISLLYRFLLVFLLGAWTHNGEHRQSSSPESCIWNYGHFFFVSLFCCTWFAF